MRLNSELAVLAGISVGAFSLYELGFKGSSFRRWLDNYLHPLVRIGTVSELHIHPIKSSRSHMVNEVHYKFTMDG